MGLSIPEATRTSAANGAPASPLLFKPLTIILASLLAAAVIATVGSLSDICLGDENTHVRIAHVYAETGSRFPYDPIFAIDSRTSCIINATPLWHAGLAVLWRLTGTESQMMAQAYQAGFYLLLLLSVYFGVRRIWGDSAASWAWLLIATMPMVCAYSILLYQDVPGIAVSALGLFFLFRRNFLWAGFCLGAAYLVRMNMLSYVPWAVAFAAWWSGGSWKRRLTAAALVAAPVSVALGYDILWRLDAFGSGMGFGELDPIPVGLSASARGALSTKPEHFLVWNPDMIYDLRSLLMNVGIPFLACVCVGVVRAWDSVAKWVWACVGLALAGFVMVFAVPGYSQIRYMFPVIFVLVFICGRGGAHWRLLPWMKVVIIFACVAQAAATCGYVSHRRQISDNDKAAYAWIRENSPKDASIVYPEDVMVNQTGRRVIWRQINLAYFMTEARDEQRQELLKWFRVSHIAIPLRRIYDREKEGDHWGGYPRDFVEKAQSLPYLKKVYENPGFIIFEFNCQEQPRL